MLYVIWCGRRGNLTVGGTLYAPHTRHCELCAAKRGNLAPTPVSSANGVILRALRAILRIGYRCNLGLYLCSRFEKQTEFWARSSHYSNRQLSDNPIRFFEFSLSAFRNSNFFPSAYYIVHTTYCKVRLSAESYLVLWMKGLLFAWSISHFFRSERSLKRSTSL